MPAPPGASVTPVADAFVPPPPGAKLPPCSNDLVVHYSFDMAQQVHYPHDPLQPDPVYFLTPRKCAIFGVCCEGLPRQINYLIDEASDTGKGANTIVSMLHHFFAVHGLGETTVHLHADNCVGQNKNNTMLQYLLWRVMVGLHHSITLSFLVVGHTKFSPDWCFGLLKQRFRRTKVGCLDNLVKVVDSSAGVNIAQLVGTQEGEKLVTTYNWAAYFARQFRKLKNMKRYRHFRFDAGTPGIVYVKTAADGNEEAFSLLVDRDWVPSSSSLPDIVPPNGLSFERQCYLHNTIAEFCPEECRDRVCQTPVALLPSTHPSCTPLSHTPPAPLSSAEPTAKKARLCGKCKEPGHNAATCRKE